MNRVNLGNIFLIGPLGAGKSTIGRTLAQQLKFKFYDSDEEVEERTGADIAWIFDIEGEAGFRKREQKVIYDLAQKNNIVLATGGGAIVTQENRLVLAGHGTVVYLKTSLEQQYKRTRRDSKRPLLQTDDVMSRLKLLKSQRDPYYEEIADVSFDTDTLSIKNVSTQIINFLRDS